MSEEHTSNDNDGTNSGEDHHTGRRTFSRQPLAPFMDGLREVILKAAAVADKAGKDWSELSPDSELGRHFDAMSHPLIAEYAPLTMLLQLRNHPEVTADLKAMEYAYFQGTRYWFLVRAYTLYQHGQRCEQCQAPGEIDVYHRRKDRQGAELFHPEDVCVLCQSCHTATGGR